jgi:hypothetical protein
LEFNGGLGGEPDVEGTAQLVSAGSGQETITCIAYVDFTHTGQTPILLDTVGSVTFTVNTADCSGDFTGEPTVGETTTSGPTETSSFTGNYMMNPPGTALTYSFTGQGVSGEYDEADCDKDEEGNNTSPQAATAANGIANLITSGNLAGQVSFFWNVTPVGYSDGTACACDDPNPNGVEGIRNVVQSVEPTPTIYGECSESK